MPYFFVPEITGFVHIHTFWEDFWQPKRSSNCEEKLWKLRIEFQPISKCGTLIAEWIKVSETTVGGWTQPRFADIFYMAMKFEPCNPKKIGVFKNKNTKPLPRIPRKILSKRNLFADLFWVQVSALMVSVTHGSAGITAICSMCPVTPACGMPNIYTEVGGGKSENSPRQWKATATEIYHFFSGKSPEKLHPTTRHCANTSWYWEKQVHVDT